MAGNYPNPISWRMAYDRDGTTGFKLASGVITQLTTVQLQAMNDEGNGSYGDNGTFTIGLVFPEKRDLAGYCVVSGDSRAIYQVQTSTNTTNGQDGTWSNLGSTIQPPNTDVKPYYRTSVTTAAATGIVGIRFANTANDTYLKALHVYGNIASGENPNRLELWHPTNDERLPALSTDEGNVPRSSSADIEFRVKNLSATLTANSVVVSMDSLTDTTPSVPGQHTLNYNGGSFAATAAAGTLAPGAISQKCVLRRVTPSNAVLGLWSFRVLAAATSWS